MDIYYAVWASLRTLPLPYRATIVTIAVFFLVWFGARRIFLLLYKLLLWLLEKVVVLLFFLGLLLLSPLAQGSAAKYVKYCNGLIDVAGCWGEGLRKRLGRAKWQLRPRWMALFALIFFVPVLLPAWLGSGIPPQYHRALELYMRLEASTLERAAAYEPLFAISSAGSIPAFGEPAPEANHETWLTLSKKGQAGSNVREGPGTEYASLSTVSGEAQLLYLDEQSGNWLRIRCQNGTEGWIHVSLIQDPPD